MNLGDITAHIERIEKNVEDLSEAARYRRLDLWIYLELTIDKYPRWWPNFPIGVSYQRQIETLKLKGVI